VLDSDNALPNPVAANARKRRIAVEEFDLLLIQMMEMQGLTSRGWPCSGSSARPPPQTLEMATPRFRLAPLSTDAISVAAGSREVRPYTGPFPTSGAHEYEFLLYALGTARLNVPDKGLLDGFTKAVDALSGWCRCRPTAVMRAAGWWSGPPCQSNPMLAAAHQALLMVLWDKVGRRPFGV
jgi:Phosphatidylethanolamine-binding protein